MPTVPCGEARECGRPQVALQISPGARDVLHVLRLAVPLPQAQPQPQEAGVALGAEVGIGRGKRVAVEGWLARRGRAAIVLEERALEPRRHAGAGILQEGDEIEGGMLVERVL